MVGIINTLDIMPAQAKVRVLSPASSNTVAISDENYEALNAVNQGMVIFAERLGIAPAIGIFRVKDAAGNLTGEERYYVHRDTVEAAVAAVLAVAVPAQ